MIDRIRSLCSRDNPAPMAYAGVGSRETPPDVLDEMRAIASVLQSCGFCLFTGGCHGADDAFADGCHRGSFRVRDFQDRRATFLPWPSYNGTDFHGLAEPTSRAFAIAAEHHPGWEHISNGGRKMHARNVHIVLGRDCKSPVRFVVCWTPDGADGGETLTTPRTGGTGQAIRIARHHGVPVFNLQREAHRRAWKAVCG